MRILRWAYMQLHVFIKGHLPLGTLVRFKPGIGLDGIYWKSPGDPMINSIGLVIDGWRKNVHPMPPGMLVSGSVVLFDGEQYDMENSELEVIDETR
jgi:hypothetical protein